MSGRVVEVYRRFAEVEAKGVSDVYFDWASGVARDAEVASLIDSLPGFKIQPNLVFAASRHLGAPIGAYPLLRSWLLENWMNVVPVVLARATQTNEAAPTRLPSVAWRAGADLNPIAPTDRDQIAWLETLVWPEHTARRDRLHAAAGIAAADPPVLVQGDIVTAVPQLVDQAPPGTSIVVFNSAALAYLPRERRQMFAEQMLTLDDVTWISSEAAGVFPSIAEQVGRDVGSHFVVAVDGQAVALAGPHGQSYEALV